MGSGLVSALRFERKYALDLVPVQGGQDFFFFLEVRHLQAGACPLPVCVHRTAVGVYGNGGNSSLTQVHDPGLPVPLRVLLPGAKSTSVVH